MYPDKQMQKQSGIFQKEQCVLDNQKPASEEWSSTKVHLNDSKKCAEGLNMDYEAVMEKEKLLSSIFVDIGETYGTRMQTIILVDYDHNVYLTERTRIPQTFPFEWKVKKFEFKFN